VGDTVKEEGPRPVRRVVVQYRAKPEFADENQRLVEADDDSNPLDDVAAFASFSREIGARCEAPPKVNMATLVGAYRCFELETDATASPSP